MTAKTRAARAAPAMAADTAASHPTPSTAPAPATACPRRGDAALFRGIARWRRTTARLVVLLNAQPAGPAMAGELHALARHCARLAGSVQDVAEQARRSDERSAR